MNQNAIETIEPVTGIFILSIQNGQNEKVYALGCFDNLTLLAKRIRNYRLVPQDVLFVTQLDINVDYGEKILPVIWTAKEFLALLRVSDALRRG
jgi:hypothetical protein